MNKEEFVEKHCKECGSQRCEGIGTAWFDGCPFRGELTSVEEFLITYGYSVDEAKILHTDIITAQTKKD